MTIRTSLSKKFSFCLLIIFMFHAPSFAQKHRAQNDSKTLSYPNFQDNPHLNDSMREMMAPYLLPLDHPAKETLDFLFSQSRVIENQETLLNAGFTIIASMPASFVIVARHPAIPGYVFKLYYDSEKRSKKGIASWEWLTRRCVGAANVRRIIQKKKIRHFVVPDKWLYVLPVYPLSNESHPKPVIVVETDMQLAGTKMTTFAWKNYVTKEHLDELYAILKHGYGTIGLVRNIPYTKNGKFAFTDTEYPKRNLKLEKAKHDLSEEMRDYWDTLIH